MTKNEEDHPLSAKPKKFYKQWWYWVLVALIASIVAVAVSGPSQPQQASAPTKNAPSITGFAATQADWNSNHRIDPRFASGTAYNPDSSLPDPSHNDRYLVQVDSGRVLSYEMRIPEGQNIDEAKAAALSEFPADAKVIWFAQRSQCSQMEVQSDVVDAALSDPAAANASGTALVEFQSQGSGVDTTYDPTNNNDLFFNVGSYATPSDAPGC